MTGLQVLGVALIALGLVYASVYVAWLRRTRRVTWKPVADPVAAEVEQREAQEPLELPVAPMPVASPVSRSVSRRHGRPQARSTRTVRSAADAAAGVSMRYLGTRLVPAPKRAEAKSLAAPADGIVRVTGDAVTWRPARGTALRCEARGLRSVVGLAASPSKPFVVTWQPEPVRAPVTHETTFMVVDPVARSAVADALRGLLDIADLVGTIHVSDATTPTASSTATATAQETM